MLTYDEFLAEAKRLNCRVLPQGDELHLCLDLKDAEIASLKLTEVAAKEVFGVVVQQKRDLEANERKLRDTISEQQKIIEKFRQKLNHFPGVGHTTHEAESAAGEFLDEHPMGLEISFQRRVQPWMFECFGQMIAGDTEERNHRFLEEALELVQACGCSQDAAHQLVDYVYGRPIGEKRQEVGGVMVTLAALCLAQQLDMDSCGETELARIWTKVDQIRAKQAAKPKHSPLPQLVP